VRGRHRFAVRADVQEVKVDVLEKDCLCRALHTIAHHREDYLEPLSVVRTSLSALFGVEQRLKKSAGPYCDAYRNGGLSDQVDKSTPEHCGLKCWMDRIYAHCNVHSEWRSDE
jgi:hypothetical protein